MPSPMKEHVWLVLVNVYGTQICLLVTYIKNDIGTHNKPIKLLSES